MSFYLSLSPNKEPSNEPGSSDWSILEFSRTENDPVSSSTVAGATSSVASTTFAEGVVVAGSIPETCVTELSTIGALSAGAPRIVLPATGALSAVLLVVTVGAFKLGPFKLGPFKLGAFKVGPFKLSPLRIDPPKSGSFKLGPPKFDSFELSPPKLGPLEFGTGT